jgi:TolB protein
MMAAGAKPIENDDKPCRVPVSWFLLGCLTLGSGAAPAQDPSDELPGTLVFAATVDGNWDLFSWQGDRRPQLARLTQTPYDEKSPALSSDRKQLAFATSAGDLVVLDLETGTSRVLDLGDYPGHWDFPSFSANGRELVCTYFEGDERDRARLAVVDLATETVRFPLAQPGPQVSPAWSPAGGPIVYAYGHCSDACGAIIQEPWLVNLATGRARQLVMTGAHTGGFAWDPAGERIGFESDQSGAFDVWLLRPETDELTRVTEHPGFDGSPAFSPVGGQLAFVSNRSGTSKIWIRDEDSGSVALFDPLGSEDNAAYKDVDWK